MAVGSEPRCFYRKVWETTGNFGHALEAQLDEAGVSVTGTVRRGVTPDSVRAAAPFYEFTSLPLSAYVGYLFKYSNNIAAEMLVKTIAADNNNGRGGSWDSAAALVGRWWKRSGLPGTLQLRNGSGMGTVNRLTAEQTVALLRHVWRRKDYYPDFCAALSIAGVDGTLGDRFTRSRLKGFVRAKTGTLNSDGVSSLAGYAFVGGKTYAFAVFVNDTKHGQFDHWILQEKLLELALPQAARPPD
jgi:D-alanyl-D-alanine carboxypeptidase/D-alanyl-D-alanine-endopeptidase (penicillin-binding protein 4)